MIEGEIDFVVLELAIVLEGKEVVFFVDVVISPQVYHSKRELIPSLKPSAAIESTSSRRYLFFFKEKIDTIIP